MESLLTSANPIFRAWAFYVGLLGLKTLCMAFLTARQRFRTGAFASLEDTRRKGHKVRVDEDVERVRRAHLNDLENIPIFMVLSLAYVGTGPSATVALWIFRAFTAARFIHTFVYAVVVVRQPARLLAFAVAMAINVFLAGAVILHFV